MKNSFIIYNSFYEPLKNLSNEQLGKLFRAIFDYTIDGKVTEDNEILVAFMFIKNQLDMDNEKYQDIKQKRSEAGKKHKGNQYTKGNKMEQMEQNGTNGSDNDNVNVNDNDIYKKKNIKKKKYGEFDNVLLTDEEYKKLEEKDLLSFIERLSTYVASTGTRYKSHYATILNWSRKEPKQVKENSERELKQLGKNGFQL